MNKKACEFERAVAESLKSGISDEKFSAHLSGCADCRDTARVISFFQKNLMNESPPKHLPVAGFIWWKSRLREKQQAAEKVGQPIFIVKIVAAFSFGGIFLWLLNNGWLRFLALDRIFDSMDQIFVPLFAVSVGFLFVCLILIFTLRRYLLEG